MKGVSWNCLQIDTAQKFNKSIIVFSGMNPDEIEDAREKIDFKRSKQKHFDKPLYCKALKTITPVKKDPPAGDENKQDEEKADKNEQNEESEDETETEEREAIAKPKLAEKISKKNGIIGSTSQKEKTLSDKTLSVNV